MQPAARRDEDGPAGASVPPLSCALDAEGQARQRARYRRVAPAVAKMERRRALLVVDFAPDLDRATLTELLAVERECCPFLSLRFNERSRRLRVGVRDLEAAVALDAIAGLLSPDAAVA